MAQTYRIKIEDRALKEISTLSVKLQARVMEAIGTLAHTPRPVGVQKLKSVENGYRIRVGDYRVLYYIEDRIVTVTVFRVGNRREVYRGLTGS